MAPGARNDATAPSRATRKTGSNIATPEESQDIKDSLEGRKFLEKYSLLCPAGEPASNGSIAYCLHQISVMAGIPKQAVNAIRASAFLLEEIEELAINETIRVAFDSQITEFTSDMKTLIEDANLKIDQHLKEAVEQATQAVKLAHLPLTQIPQADRTERPPNALNPNNHYANALINPPPNVNPVLAAKEGIKARQFLLVGIKDATMLETQKLKTNFNKTAKDLGLTGGKIRSVLSQKDGNILFEVDSEVAAVWFTNETNRVDFCVTLGDGVRFQKRIFNVLAFNVPLNLDPSDDSHCEEINETNDLEENTITSIRWAKPINRRSDYQRTAHLILSFSNPEDANYSITNGITICNKKCHVEKIRREPIRCLKCQRWNHMAKDCSAKVNTCSNCAGIHKTESCLHPNSITRCVSCDSHEHASWSRQCPTFLKRVVEFKERNPESLLPYFPTADPWTWSTDATNVTQKQKIASLPKKASVNLQKGKEKATADNTISNTNIPYDLQNSVPDAETQEKEFRAWWGDEHATRPTTYTNQPTHPSNITQSGTAGPSDV